MILDSLKSFEKYQMLHEGFDKVYQFIKKTNLNELEVGEYEIDGKKVYCKIWKGELKGLEVSQMEVHDSYIDIHVLLGGSETIGLKDRGKCSDNAVPYDEANDITFFDDEPENYIVLGINNIAVIFPADAHAPLLGEGECKKAVFKVQVGRAKENNRF